MVWKRRKLAALMVCDVCAPWALNVWVCLRPEEAPWPASGPPASVCHSAEVTLVVMWRVDAVSLEHITDDRRAGLRQWELQSLLSTIFFLSGLTPTPLGLLSLLFLLSVFLDEAPDLSTYWKWLSIQMTLPLVILWKERYARTHVSGFWRPGCLKWAQDRAGAFRVVWVVKNPPAKARDIRDAGSIPGSGRSTRGGQPTPVFLPGESHGQRSLAGYSLECCKESNMTEATEYAHKTGLKQ